MNKISRLALFIFILGIILLLGLVFSAWVIPNIVKPVAETVWLFLRVFILSVDQIYYWNLLSIAVVVWVIYRLFHRQSSVLHNESVLRNEAINNLKNWQDALENSKHAADNRSVIRDKLLQLVIAHYACRQQNPNQLEIRKELEQHYLPLPYSVYNFLFPPASSKLKKPTLRAIYQACRWWYFRISGQEAIAFNKILDELIDFLNA